MDREELRLLIVELVPGLPAISCIDKVLLDTVNRNLTPGQIVYPLVAPYMVAVTMRVDNQIDLCQAHSGRLDPVPGYFEVPHIARVDEDLVLPVKDEMFPFNQPR